MKTILLLWAAVFLFNLLSDGLLGALLVFRPVFPFVVTGLVTYPLVVGDILGLLLNGFVFYIFGSSLERSWGWRRFLNFLLLTNSAAVGIWVIGVVLFTSQIPTVAGPWFMLSSVVVAWAFMNPEETIMLWFVIPVKAKWIGWLDIALLFFLMPAGVVPGLMIPLLGPFALGGITAAILYTRWERKWGWIPRQPKDRDWRGRPIRPAEKPKRQPLIHPSSTPLGRLFAPYREWKRRQNIKKLRDTFKLDD